MENKVCKIFILENKEQRVLKPHLHENLIQKVIRKKSAIKKCLFGVADPEDTQKMLEEQYQLDKERFLHSFGINIQDIEEMENLKDNDVENNKNEHNQIMVRRNMARRPILKAKRKSLGKLQSSANQQHITDFYQARKSGQQTSLEKKLATTSNIRENLNSINIFRK